METLQPPTVSKALTICSQLRLRRINGNPARQHRTVMVTGSQLRLRRINGNLSYLSQTRRRVSEGSQLRLRRINGNKNSYGDERASIVLSFG